MPRGNINNLKLIQTTEEAKKKGKNGGIKSGQTRRRKKTLKEQMQMLLSLNVSDTECKKVARKLGLNEDQIDYGLLMNLAQLTKAIKEKDTRAAEFVRDLVGEKPTNQVEVKNTDIEDLTPLATLLKPKKEQEQDMNNDDNEQVNK